MITEIKYWTSTCDGCGKVVEQTGPIMELPDDWREDKPEPSYVDGYSVFFTRDNFHHNQYKHYCSDCWAIKDVIE